MSNRNITTLINILLKSSSCNGRSSSVRNVWIDRLLHSKLKALSKKIHGDHNIVKSSIARHRGWIKGHLGNIIILLLNSGHPLSLGISICNSQPSGFVSGTFYNKSEKLETLFQKVGRKVRCTSFWIASIVSKYNTYWHLHQMHRRHSIVASSRTDMPLEHLSQSLHSLVLQHVESEQRLHMILLLFLQD